VVSSFVNSLFPINTKISLTSKGSISKPCTLTNPIEQTLISLGAKKGQTYHIPNNPYGLQPDFEITTPQGIVIGMESQFGLRESVFFDFLKHAELQRIGKFQALIEIIPDDNIVKNIPGAAGFSWLNTMINNIVIPYLVCGAVNFVIVPIDLR
jgi:hypothetical protein